MDLSQPENKAWSDVVNNLSSSGHRAWYFARDTPDKGDGTGDLVGLNTSLEFIGRLLKNEGPVHAIWGFSQGAGLAGMLCALLQAGKTDHALRSLMPTNLITPLAGIVFSGFKARFAQFDTVYEGGIDVPMMHIIGESDSLVRSERSQALIHSCSQAKILKHSGGHNIPKGDADVRSIVEFVRQYVVSDKISTSV